ncbi:MAG: citramalate synthase, partial [Deltaproteobacteria bacterium]|nr:citramalate synthase [Deltaproteobacteria bacterium]
SNPKDAEFFARAREMKWQTATVVAFSSTRRVNLSCENDPNMKALLDAGTSTCAVFGKTWTLHVTEVLRTTLDENLKLIEDTVAYLRANNRRVIYDAEHFFSGFQADREYALATLAAAVRGGAETLALCDTNGGTMPHAIANIVSEVVAKNSGVKIGIHTHNDSECAVANSVAAVQAGALHVQGTINGYGERCGNANLCAVVPNIELKLGLRCMPENHLTKLTDTSHYIAEIANQNPDEFMAYVGRNAFAHKAGVHVSAMRRDKDSYQHIDPELVGNKMIILVSELSGRSNIMSKVDEFTPQFSELVQGGDIKNALQQVKDNEARGFSYEAADASVALIMMRQAPQYQPLYELIDYMVNVEHRDQRGSFAEATVKVRVKGEVVHTAAEGDGPVNALDNALRKALGPVYPMLNHVKLTDYKVRILDSGIATAAITRVLIDSTDGVHTWSTVGASQNIIEASWAALGDALEYGIRLSMSNGSLAGATKKE